MRCLALHFQGQTDILYSNYGVKEQRRFENQNISIGLCHPNYHFSCRFRKDSAITVLRFSSDHDSRIILSPNSKDGIQNKGLQLLQHVNYANSINYASLLRECGSKRTLREGKRVYDQIIKNGLGKNTFLCTLLVEMFGKCGDVENAEAVFHKLGRRNIFLWTAMISTYAQNGYAKKAFLFFQHMQEEGIKADRVVYLAVLKAPCSPEVLSEGKLIHAQVIKSGVEWETFIANTLLNMYGKCGSMEDVWMVFSLLQQKDTITWNAMLACHLHNGNIADTLHLYREMIREGLKPDRITFLTVLDACISIRAPAQGKCIHSSIILYGLGLNIAVGSALVNLYGKCGCLKDSYEVFEKMPRKNAVSWNTMMASYFQNGEHKSALLLFHEMRGENTEPTKVTFISMLDSCITLSEGKLTHANILLAQVLRSDVLVRTSLVNMYGKCQSLKDAYLLFNEKLDGDIILSTAMIAACTQNGYAKEAIELFKEIQEVGMQPDRVAYLSILDVCTSYDVLPQGKLIHSNIAGSSFLKNNVSLNNALSHMYGKCGCLKDACAVFDIMNDQNVVSWTTMLAVYCQYGYGMQAMKIFSRMQFNGVKPNATTFINLLSACNHAGKQDEGHHFFVSMATDNGITVGLEHYACMVDLLGRVGWLDEAGDLIQGMSYESDDVVWMSFLAACQVYNLQSEGYFRIDKLDQNWPRWRQIRPEFITKVDSG